ncbi:MAG: imidazolonepropionase, partial [Acidobacteria bacterium]
MTNSLLITGASQLLTLRGSGARRGNSLSNLGLVKDGAVLVRDGVIAAVGTQAQVEALPEARSAEKLDLGGRVALPGFVDSHTHLVHAASRAEEYESKIAGASYEEIARKGGGILNSVKQLRAATAKELKKRALAALQQFAAYGSTTIEAKSGYGLELASELKILRLHKELANEQPLEIVSTFLGAHAVPEEYGKKAAGRKRYLRLLEEDLLPEIGEGRLAEFCDVFCDRGAFSVEESKRVLQAGRQWGLAPRMHAEQLSRTGATRLAILLRAASCDHL